MPACANWCKPPRGCAHRTKKACKNGCYWCQELNNYPPPPHTTTITASSPEQFCCCHHFATIWTPPPPTPPKDWCNLLIYHLACHCLYVEGVIHCIQIIVLCTVHTANEEPPVRIQYKCLVPIYVFPETKLLLSKQNYNVLFPSSYTHISLRDLYISRIGLPILLQGNYMDGSWKYIHRSQTHECGNQEWGRAIPRKGIHKWDFPCSAVRNKKFKGKKSPSMLFHGLFIASSPKLYFGNLSGTRCVGNKCTGRHNMITFCFKETLVLGNFLAWSSTIVWVFAALFLP